MEFDDRLANAPLFRFGEVVATQGAIDALVEAQEEPLDYLRRHGKGDWGELDPEDLVANESALNRGGRIFSAYTLPTGERLWIITEWDRSYTTFLLPSEY